MNQNDMIASIAAVSGESKSTVKRILDAQGTIVTDLLRNRRTEVGITLVGIGKISVTRRQARTGRNPKTGEPVQIEAKNAVKIKPAKALSDAAN